MQLEECLYKLLQISTRPDHLVFLYLTLLVNFPTCPDSGYDFKICVYIPNVRLYFQGKENNRVKQKKKKNAT